MKYSYLRQLDADIVGGSTAIFCHWCGRSQAYAGGDALLTLLDQGYHIKGYVLRQIIHFKGNRRSELFHFRLEHDNALPIDMPVLRNPFVVRLIRRLKLKIYKLKNVRETSNAVENENKQQTQIATVSR